MKKYFLTTSAQVITALAVFVSRLGSLPANFSPLGSFGFFGSKPILFFAVIISFDIFVKGLYPGFWLTYLGFAAYPILGFLTRKHWKRQLIGLPAASLLFFLLSNFGVWLYWYEPTLSNLLLVYSLGLPFYQRTLIGDLFFGYGFMAAIRLKPHLTKLQIRELVRPKFSSL